MQNLVIQNLAKAKSNNANFASAKSTHPHPTGCEALAEAKTPSAREGDLRTVATLSREGAFFGLPRAISCARNDGNICHTERSEVSQKNIDCHAKSNDFARNDR